MPTMKLDRAPWTSRTREGDEERHQRSAPTALSVFVPYNKRTHEGKAAAAPRTPFCSSQTQLCGGGGCVWSARSPSARTLVGTHPERRGLSITRKSISVAAGRHGKGRASSPAARVAPVLAQTQTQRGRASLLSSRSCSGLAALTIGSLLVDKLVLTTTTAERWCAL